MDESAAVTEPSATPSGRHRIAVLAGDGIGPEIVDACRPVLAAAFPTWDFVDAEIGWARWCADGDPVPATTWRTLETADAALMAAVTSKPAREAEAELAEHLRGTGLTYRSPVLQLRGRLDLHANVRPIRDLLARDDSLDDGSGSPARFGFTVVRENTEGLYSHDVSMASDEAAGIRAVIEHDSTVVRSTPRETAVALRVTTGYGWRRLLRTAASLTGRAADPSLRRVTVADKPNILRESGAIIRDAIDAVAPEFPDVEFTMANVDAVTMEMVRAPEKFDVIAAENLLGDILSDLGAGLMGGLGLPAAANIGADHAVFEPVHGSAPDIAGRGIANPAAYLLAAAMCAEHLAATKQSPDLAGAATRLRRGVRATLREHPTPDLGGTATTREFAEAVARRL
ncbi:isocitrate/isopropylmalate dehydrogenase family protein [uncultured Corynebacterium sp.]|uniref:isocitrate/isopropylmalate dehydrogenase family protein n=1 Tax=uncultured Corynebacterium sp. TaxID=159447 RepID=UPI0025CC154F|nr:isocitrate/isopropylmalate family dehydrogenase [uncultured Corynebacterium sp.]